MSALDLEALESAAKATEQSQWVYLAGGVWGASFTHNHVRMAHVDFHASANRIKSREIGEFIAAWNPATALSVLARLRAAEIENEKLQGSLIDENARATTAEALVGELVGALKPFAEVSEKAKGTDDACWCGQDGAVIRYRDLRRAALAYKARPVTGEQSQ